MCKVPSSPESKRGTPRPQPFSPLPPRRCRQRKVPVCPNLLNRGEGVTLAMGQHSLNSTRQTDTHRQRHKSPRSPSSSNKSPLPKSPEETREARPRRLPSPRAVCTARRHPLALGADGLGGVLAAGRGPALTSGRPLLNFLSARGPRGLRRPRWQCSKG